MSPRGTWGQPWASLPMPTPRKPYYKNPSPPEEHVRCQTPMYWHAPQSESTTFCRCVIVPSDFLCARFGNCPATPTPCSRLVYDSSAHYIASIAWSKKPHRPTAGLLECIDTGKLTGLRSPHGLGAQSRRSPEFLRALNAMLMRRQFDLCDPVLATQHGSALVFLGALRILD
jgi:hypothetical protein